MVDNMDPKNEVENWFTYHSPGAGDVERYKAIRDSAKVLAFIILENTPKSADRSASLRKLRECVMTANVSIACEGKV